MTECKMLNGINNGDLVIAGNYKFIWNGHMIHNNDIFNYYECECYVSDVTKVIRISKILEFLNQQTGLKFNYYCGAIRCDGINAYDILEKDCYLTINNEIVLTYKNVYRPRIVTMEPSEFVDKISKGEWL